MIVEPKIYMDANAIVDALKHNQFAAIPKAEGVNLKDAPYFIQDFHRKKLHVEYCSKLLKAAEYNELTLLTSSLSIAEVWHLGKNAKPPSEEDKRVIMSVLSSGRVIKIVTDSIFVAERARDLSWKHGIELTGADAIHVATALEANCIEFITDDKGIIGQKEKIRKLGLNIINAQQTSGLPVSFTQPLLDTPSVEELNEVLDESEFFEEDEVEVITETKNKGELKAKSEETETSQKDERNDINKQQ